MLCGLFVSDSKNTMKQKPNTLKSIRMIVFLFYQQMLHVVKQKEDKITIHVHNTCTQPTCTCICFNVSSNGQFHYKMYMYIVHVAPAKTITNCVTINYLHSLISLQ